MDIGALYQQTVLWIGVSSGLPDTVLHIHSGLAVLVLSRVFTGRSLGSPTPWVIVLVAALGKEVLDRATYGSWRWADSTSDIVHTMFWPTVICLGVRFRPLIVGRGKAPETPSGDNPS